MSAFVERWHVDLALVGLAIGVGVVLVRRILPRPVAPVVSGVAVALVTMMALGGLSPVWAIAAVGALVASVRSATVGEDPVGVGEACDRWAVVILGSSLVGLWATVPDTEAPLLAAAVIAPVLAEAYVTRRRMTRPALAWMSILAVAAAAGGIAGWWSAVFGAACCLVVPAAAPALALRWRGQAIDPVALGATAVAHVIAMVVGSRIVAHAGTAGAALVTVVVVAGVAGVVGVAWRRTAIVA